MYLKKMNSLEFSTYIKEKGLTLGSAESFTGGLFAREITRIPGASSFFKGSVVTYATEEKINVLGVPLAVVNSYGVVSKECAYEMASCAKKLLNVNIAVSFTGNAGPSAMEGKPVGEIYIGVSINNRTETYKYNLKGDRDSIQHEAIELAFSLIKENIERAN